MDTTRPRKTHKNEVSRPKGRPRSVYDRLSRWYDLLAEGSERRLREVGLERLNVRGGEIALEIGVGTGHGVQSLAGRVGESGKVYGIDLSTGMLGVARTRVANERQSGTIHLVCADARQLPFGEGLIDVVFMSFTLELFDARDIPMVLGECQRVLKGRGRLCVVALSRQGKPGLTVRAYEWANRMFPAFVDCRPIPLQDTLWEAGYRILSLLHRSMWGLPVEIVVAAKPQADLVL